MCGSLKRARIIVRRSEARRDAMAEVIGRLSLYTQSRLLNVGLRQPDAIRALLALRPETTDGINSAQLRDPRFEGQHHFCLSGSLDHLATRITASASQLLAGICASAVQHSAHGIPFKNRARTS